MSTKSTKFLLVIGALALFVLLFIAPKIAPQHSADDGHNHNQPAQNVSENNTANLDVYLNMAGKNLEPSLGKKLEGLNKQQKFDSLALFWDQSKRPDLAAVYFEKKALADNMPESWLKAGSRYYNAVRFTKDQTEIPLLYQCAIRCVSKVLKTQPANTEARVLLASCYVEGTDDPMKGIGMMREIEKTDSNNVQLQLNFAAFSVKSGQLDKAVTRFEKAYRIDSTRIDILLYLADAYQQQGKTAKTIEVLQKYGNKTTDPMEKVEINKYIQQLK